MWIRSNLQRRNFSFTYSTKFSYFCIVDIWTSKKEFLLKKIRNYSQPLKLQQIIKMCHNGLKSFFKTIDPAIYYSWINVIFECCLLIIMVFLVRGRGAENIKKKEENSQKKNIEKLRERKTKNTEKVK